jgi:hypothetical protein
LTVLLHGVVRRLSRGAQHRAPAACMHVQHPHAESGSDSNSVGHRVRDVVVLQIEEHAIATRRERADEGGALGGEEMRVDLESADMSPEPIGDAHRLDGRIEIERHENRVHECSTVASCMLPTRSARRSMR